MAVYEITAFAGTTLTSANRCMVAVQDSKPAYIRMGLLENGAKFDADGNSDADTTLGRVRARYLCLPTSSGMRSLDGHVSVFEGIRGKVGTLTGVLTASSSTTRTCTARCVDVTTEEYVVGQQPALAATNRLYAYVTVTWEKKSEWTTSIAGSGVDGA